MVDPIVTPPAPDAAPPAPLPNTVALNPPMVGTASPFVRVDGQNRDLILEAIRAWARGPLVDWSTGWQNALIEWLDDTSNWLESWNDEVVRYVQDVLQAVIDSSIELQDPVLAGILENPLSLTRHLLDETYQSERLVDVRRFGAMGDSDGGIGGTNDTAAIEAAIAYAVSKRLVLWFPTVDIGYRSDTPIEIPGTIDVLMDSPIVGNHNGAVVSYNPTGPIANRRVLLFRTERSAQSNWSDEDNVGVRTRNVQESHITIARTRGNTIGWLRVGDNAGHVHNECHLFRIDNNKYGLDSDCLGSGWVNEEKVFGGRFTVVSGINRSEDRYGIRIRSTSGYMQNAHTYSKPSFELNLANTTGGAEAIGILVLNGNYNRFEDCRDEGNSPTVIRTLGTSQENYVSTSFSNLNGSLADDAGTNPSTHIERGMRSITQAAKYLVYDSGDLAKKAVAYSTTSTNIPSVSIAASTTGTPLRQNSGLTVNADHISVPGTRAVGRVIGTHAAKRFVLKRDTVAGGGRVIVRCYDGSMNPLPAAAGMVRSLTSTSMIVSGDFGSCFRTGADATGELYFAVSDAVKYVFVGIAGGTAPATLRSFSIYTPDTAQPLSVALHPENETTPLAVAAPETGTYSTGAVLKHGAPAVGQPKGWVCTAGGSPGTWVSEGAL